MCFDCSKKQLNGVLELIEDSLRAFEEVKRQKNAFKYYLPKMRKHPSRWRKAFECIKYEKYSKNTDLMGWIRKNKERELFKDKFKGNLEKYSTTEGSEPSDFLLDYCDLFFEGDEVAEHAVEYFLKTDKGNKEEIMAYLASLEQDSTTEVEIDLGKALIAYENNIFTLTQVEINKKELYFRLNVGLVEIDSEVIQFSQGNSQIQVEYSKTASDVNVMVNLPEISLEIREWLDFPSEYVLFKREITLFLDKTAKNIPRFLHNGFVSDLALDLTAPKVFLSFPVLENIFGLRLERLKTVPISKIMKFTEANKINIDSVRAFYAGKECFSSEFSLIIRKIDANDYSLEESKVEVEIDLKKSQFWYSTVLEALYFPVKPVSTAFKCKVKDRNTLKEEDSTLFLHSTGLSLLVRKEVYFFPFTGIECTLNKNYLTFGEPKITVLLCDDAFLPLLEEHLREYETVKLLKLDYEDKPGQLTRTLCLKVNDASIQLEHPHGSSSIKGNWLMEAKFWTNKREYINIFTEIEAEIVKDGANLPLIEQIQELPSVEYRCSSSETEMTHLICISPLKLHTSIPRIGYISHTIDYFLDSTRKNELWMFNEDRLKESTMLILPKFEGEVSDLSENSINILSVNQAKLLVTSNPTDYSIGFEVEQILLLEKNKTTFSAEINLIYANKYPEKDKTLKIEAPSFLSNIAVESNAFQLVDYYLRVDKAVPDDPDIPYHKDPFSLTLRVTDPSFMFYSKELNRQTKLELDSIWFSLDRNGTDKRVFFDFTKVSMKGLEPEFTFLKDLNCSLSAGPRNKRNEFITKLSNLAVIATKEEILHLIRISNRFKGKLTDYLGTSQKKAFYSEINIADSNFKVTDSKEDKYFARVGKCKMSIDQEIDRAELSLSCSNLEAGFCPDTSLVSVAPSAGGAMTLLLTRQKDQTKVFIELQGLRATTEIETVAEISLFAEDIVTAAEESSEMEIRNFDRGGYLDLNLVVKDTLCYIPSKKTVSDSSAVKLTIDKISSSIVFQDISSLSIKEDQFDTLKMKNKAEGMRVELVTFTKGEERFFDYITYKPIFASVNLLLYQLTDVEDASQRYNITVSFTHIPMKVSSSAVKLLLKLANQAKKTFLPLLPKAIPVSYRDSSSLITSIKESEEFVLNIESDEGISCVLVDDLASHHFPFLSFNFSSLHLFILLNSSDSKMKFSIFSNFNLDCFNFLANEWEPIIEEVKLFTEIEQKRGHTQTVVSQSIEVSPRRSKETININLSDMNVTYITSTTDNLVEAYKSTFEKDIMSFELEQKVSVYNYKIANRSGKRIILLDAEMNKLSEIEPDGYFKVEYKPEAKSKGRQEEFYIGNGDMFRKLKIDSFETKRIELGQTRLFVKISNKGFTSDLSVYSDMTIINCIDQEAVVCLKTEEHKLSKGQSIGLEASQYDSNLSIRIGEASKTWHLKSLVEEHGGSDTFSMNTEYFSLTEVSGDYSFSIFELHYPYQVQNSLPVSVKLTYEGSTTEFEPNSRTKINNLPAQAYVTMEIDEFVSEEFVIQKSEENKILPVELKKGKKSFTVNIAFRKGKAEWKVIIESSFILINETNQYDLKAYVDSNEAVQVGLFSLIGQGEHKLFFSYKGIKSVEYSTTDIAEYTDITFTRGSEEYNMVLTKQVKPIDSKVKYFSVILRLSPKYILSNESATDILLYNPINSMNLLFLEKNKRTEFFFFGEESKEISLKVAQDGLKGTFVSSSLVAKDWIDINKMENFDLCTLRLQSVYQDEPSRLVNVEKKLIKGLSFIIFTDAQENNCEVLLVNNANCLIEAGFLKFEKLAEIVPESKKMLAVPTLNKALSLTFRQGDKKSEEIFEIKTKEFVHIRGIKKDLKLPAVFEPEEMPEIMLTIRRKGCQLVFSLEEQDDKQSEGSLRRENYHLSLKFKKSIISIIYDNRHDLKENNSYKRGEIYNIVTTAASLRYTITVDLTSEYLSHELTGKIEDLQIHDMFHTNSQNQIVLAKTNEADFAVFQMSFSNHTGDAVMFINFFDLQFAKMKVVFDSNIILPFSSFGRNIVYPLSRKLIQLDPLFVKVYSEADFTWQTVENKANLRKLIGRKINLNSFKVQTTILGDVLAEMISTNGYGFLSSFGQLDEININFDSCEMLDFSGNFQEFANEIVKTYLNNLVFQLIIQKLMSFFKSRTQDITLRERYERPFYGKLKLLRNYSSLDSLVFAKLKNSIGTEFDFLECVSFKSVNKLVYLVAFSSKGVHIYLVIAEQLAHSGIQFISFAELAEFEERMDSLVFWLKNKKV